MNDSENQHPFPFFFQNICLCLDLGVKRDIYFKFWNFEMLEFF